MSNNSNEKHTKTAAVTNRASPGPPPGTPTTQTPRPSEENEEPQTALPPFLPLPPPTEAIPLGLGPDGKNLLPKLGQDGKPLKGPPLDKDGKPFPPPPIIGPDGKEIPRPTDGNGRPLPIYVSPDGKPILDKDGNPVALRFNKEGKPIPLEIELPLATPSKERELMTGGDANPPHPGEDVAGATVPLADVKNDRIPDCVFYAGIVDIIASLILTGVVIFFMVPIYQMNPENQQWHFLAGSAAISAIGAAFGVLPIMAAKKNKFNFLWIWSASAASLFILETGLLFFNPDPEKMLASMIATTFCGVRLVYTFCTNCFFANSSNDESGKEQKNDQQHRYNPIAAVQELYPKQDVGYYHYDKQQHEQRLHQIATNTMPTPSTMVVQQQTPSMIIHQPVVVQPMMGMGYNPYMYGSSMAYGAGWGGGWGGYGGYYGGCHHGFCPYYDFGWGW